MTVLTLLQLKSKFEFQKCLICPSALNIISMEKVLDRLQCKLGHLCCLDIDKQVLASSVLMLATGISSCTKHNNNIYHLTFARTFYATYLYFHFRCTQTYICLLQAFPTSDVIIAVCWLNVIYVNIFYFLICKPAIGLDLSILSCLWKIHPANTMTEIWLVQYQRTWIVSKLK